MPATAGRVRMPHNNRMQASAALKTTPIWQKTIGHDPYAGQNEPTKTPQEEELAKEKARQVLNVARQQNLTDGAQRDDFARKLYLGLKRGKKHREMEGTGVADNMQAQQTLEEDLPSSSSEDEYVEVVAKSKSKRKRSRKKRKGRRRYSIDEDSGTSSDDSTSHSSRRGRKRRKRKQKRHRDDSSNSSETSSYDSSDSERKTRKRRKHKKRKAKRKRDKNSLSKTRESDAKASFVACDKFEGSRKGFVFQMGDRGLGYYADNKPEVDAKEREEMLMLYS